MEKCGTTGGNWIALPIKAGNFLLIVSHEIVRILLLIGTLQLVIARVLTTGLKRYGKSCRLRWFSQPKSNIYETWRSSFLMKEDRITYLFFYFLFGKNYLFVTSGTWKQVRYNFLIHFFANPSHFLHIINFFRFFQFICYIY